MTAEPGWLGENAAPGDEDPDVISALEAEAEGLDGRGKGASWANSTSEERPRILADALAWRSGSLESVRRAGYETVGGWLDAAAPERGGDHAAAAGNLPSSDVKPVTDPARSVSPAPAGIDGVDLMALDLPPLRWLVPDLLPEGTTIIASPPKIGKSCLVYQAVVEVAIGGELLGRRVTPASALYLALEDGRRRGQDRLRSALAGRTLPRGRLEIRWEARPIRAGLEDDIAAWLDAHPDAGIVAIDTLGRVRPRSTGKRNAYEVDVEDLARLQGLFRDRRVALVIVHHARKDSGGDDFLQSVSGTYGLTGSADTVVVVRRKRLEAFGSLVVTGRDVPDAEIPVRFDGHTWQTAPASLPEASFERLEVYRVVEADGPIFPAAVAEQLGLGRTSVQNMVTKLVEQGAVARTPTGYVVARARVTNVPHDSDDSEKGRGVTGVIGDTRARAREGRSAAHVRLQSQAAPGRPTSSPLPEHVVDGADGVSPSVLVPRTVGTLADALPWYTADEVEDGTDASPRGEGETPSRPSRPSPHARIAPGIRDGRGTQTAPGDGTAPSRPVYRPPLPEHDRDGRDGTNPSVLGLPSAGPTPPPCADDATFRAHASAHRIRDGATLCDACQPTPAVAS